MHNSEKIMAFTRISVEEAKVLIEKTDVTLADVRDAASFSAANIPNSLLVSNDTVNDFLATSDKEKPLIIYCYHGNSSQGAADYFSEQGFKEVYSLDGGFEEWRLKP